jgi:HPt (histidine-containing phosphotransfer) domain-containing protein
VASERLRQESDEAGTTRPECALDREGALERLGGDPQLLRDVAQTFRVEAPRLLGLIRAAVAAGDANTMRRAAHTLHGSAGVFAAAGIMSLARQLEEVGISGRMEEAPAALAALEAHLDPFLASLADLAPDPGAKTGPP